jgi:hypothetical protein
MTADVAFWVLMGFWAGLLLGCLVGAYVQGREVTARHQFRCPTCRKRAQSIAERKRKYG